MSFGGRDGNQHNSNIIENNHFFLCLKYFLIVVLCCPCVARTALNYFVVKIERDEGSSTSNLAASIFSHKMLPLSPSRHFLFHLPQPDIHEEQRHILLY